MKELIQHRDDLSEKFLKRGFFQKSSSIVTLKLQLKNISARKKPNTSSVKDGGGAAIEVAILKFSPDKLR
jgi:hypothetical protein